MKFKSISRAAGKMNAGFSKGYPYQRWVWMTLLVFFLGLFQRQTLAQSRIAQTTPVPSASASNVRTFTDEIGRHVEVASEVKRIVSLAPNLTEIVYALGEGNHLVGDTDFCDYPPEATRKPHVGGPINPSLEQIVALRPDVVLVTAINRRETVDALARIGVPVYAADPHSVNDMITSIQHIGEVLHVEKTAAPMVEDLRARLSSLDRRLAGAARRRVLFVVWTDPLISIGRDTFIADALRRGGARSVADTSEEWPRVSLEEIVRLQPEFIVFASSHAGDAEHDVDALRTRPGWRDLDALRRGNIVIISDAINRPAPRMLDAIEQLARALHSDSFASREPRLVSAANISEEFCACAR